MNILKVIYITARDRLTRTGTGSGRRKKEFKKSGVKSLGGIPMKIKDGKIIYAQYVPKNYSIDGNGEPYDSESIQRKYATLPTGDGNYVRRHLYEVKFEIREDETEDERRKREYREWIERELK